MSNSKSVGFSLSKANGDAHIIMFFLSAFVIHENHAPPTPDDTSGAGEGGGPAEEPAS